jgi:hypothetical protein
MLPRDPRTTQTPFSRPIERMRPMPGSESPTATLRSSLEPRGDTTALPGRAERKTQALLAGGDDVERVSGVGV